MDINNLNFLKINLSSNDCAKGGAFNWEKLFSALRTIFFPITSISCMRT
jgi:hypothetical protein